MQLVWMQDAIWCELHFSYVRRHTTLSCQWTPHQPKKRLFLTSASTFLNCVPKSWNFRTQPFVMARVLVSPSEAGELLSQQRDWMIYHTREKDEEARLRKWVWHTSLTREKKIFKKEFWFKVFLRGKKGVLCKKHFTQNQTRRWGREFKKSFLKGALCMHRCVLWKWRDLRLAQRTVRLFLSLFHFHGQYGLAKLVLYNTKDTSAWLRRPSLLLPVPCVCRCIQMHISLL